MRKQIAVGHKHQRWNWVRKELTMRKNASGVDGTTVKSVKQ